MVQFDRSRKIPAPFLFFLPYEHVLYFYSPPAQTETLSKQIDLYP